MTSSRVSTTCTTRPSWSTSLSFHWISSRRSSLFLLFCINGFHSPSPVMPFRDHASYENVSDKQQQAEVDGRKSYRVNALLVNWQPALSLAHGPQMVITYQVARTTRHAPIKTHKS